MTYTVNFKNTEDDKKFLAETFEELDTDLDGDQIESIDVTVKYNILR